ncbi:MAG TPA: proton-conducting transporter membrane subunit [Gemmatimonadaceae bacterium]|nr:proton-conducting transporter membrane subunit [Gemmatimonadaceae bacterium]
MITDSSGIIDVLAEGLAIWPVVIPLAAAALTLLLRRWPTLQRSVMEVAVAMMLVAAAVLLARTRNGEAIVMKFGGWGKPFGVTFVADMLSAMLCTAAGTVALAVAIFARADVRARRRRAGFDALFLGMLAAVNGAFLTGDLFNLYVWFELMLATALGLVTLDRRRAQIDGALRYAAMSMMGATFMLVGIGLLYGETGTLDLVHLSTTLARGEPSVTSSVAAYLLLAGLLLKAGLFPLFFWLPASYHTAPISVAAALAGLLTKVAFYACLRVFVLVFGVGAHMPVVSGMPPLFALLAAATMLVSVFAAIAQVDVRRLLAFHVVGQVAYLVMGLALASWQGSAAAIFYTVHTMLVQTGLFLGAGAIGRAGGGFDLRVLGGLIREHPRFSVLFAALALSISGVPPLSGFWAKALVIDAAFRSGTPGAAWLVVAALATGFLTLYSMSTLWTQAFWRPRARAPHAARAIPVAMVTGVALMAACTLGLGLAIEPAVRLSRAAATQLGAGVTLPNGTTSAGASGTVP